MLPDFILKITFYILYRMKIISPVIYFKIFQYKQCEVCGVFKLIFFYSWGAVSEHQRCPNQNLYSKSCWLLSEVT